MKQELIVTGSTIEEALRNGAEQLGVMPEELKYEVLVEPKKGILGIGRVAAKLKVCYEEAEAPAEKTTSVAKTAPAKRMETAEENSVALRFVRTLLEDMEYWRPKRPLRKPTERKKSSGFPGRTPALSSATTAKPWMRSSI